MRITSRMLIALIALELLFLGWHAQAQELPDEPRPTFRQILAQPDFLVPSAFLLGSLAADAIVSNHWAGQVQNRSGYICAYEGNSLFATQDGAFSVGKFAAWNAPKLGFIVVSYEARKRAPQSKVARVLTAILPVAAGIPHAVAAGQWINMCR